MQHYQVGRGFAMWVHAREPLGCGADQLGRVRRARMGRPAGLSRVKDSEQKPNSNKKTFFFFKTIL
jgi:hypothetical protein